MDTEAFAASALGKVFIKALAAGMESRFRYRFFSPTEILSGADILPGQVVLEVGCGTGYFTLPAARLLGEAGRLTAIDVVPESVALVSTKAEAAGLKNVRVIKADARNTGLDSESFDAILLLGIIPAPMLPLAKLLPELHRLLKVDGILSVWPPVPGWLPQSILQSSSFMLHKCRNGVHIFRRC
jgi:ubiquinone/menaquinone biosynthesis C-methylase UbiE